MTVISRPNYTDFFFDQALPQLEEIYFSEYESWPDLMMELADYETGTGWGTQTTEFSGVGIASKIEEGESVVYDDTVQGNSKTFTYGKYGIGVKPTEEMVDDERWGMIRDIYRSMGASVVHIRQQLFFDNFNNGFTVNGYDGVPLFSTAHPLIKAGGTQANRPSVDVDFGVTSYRAALTSIADWLTHEGLKAFFMPYCLLVSTAGVYDAHEIVKSDYRPGTADNNVSGTKSAGYDLDIKKSPYLTDNDAWFMLCKNHKIKFIERKAPQMKSQVDFDADCIKSKVTTRFDTGHGSWFGGYGSSGN